MGKRKRSQLRCEWLEGRDCPTVQVFNVGGVLTIVGDNTANDVDIVDTGADVQVSVDSINQGDPTTYENVTRVIVQGRRGNDRITYTASAVTEIRSVMLLGAADNDTITVDAVALDPTSTTAATTQIVVSGGQGADTLDARLGNVAEGDTLTLVMDGGTGADALTANAIGAVVGGTLNVTVGGSTGSDTLIDIDLNNVTISDTGLATVTARGQTGSDNPIHVSGIVTVEGTLTLSANGGQGDDDINLVDLTVTSDADSTVNVNVNGGQGDDNIDVHLLPGDIDGTLNVVVDGGVDDDFIDTNVAVSDDDTVAEIVSVVVRGWQGIDDINLGVDANVDATLTVVASGGTGGDTISSSLNIAGGGDAGATGDVIGRVNGGQGSDNLNFTVTLNNAVPTATELNDQLGNRSFILDGGLGFDTGSFTENIVQPINVE